MAGKAEVQRWGTLNVIIAKYSFTCEGTALEGKVHGTLENAEVNDRKPF